MISPGNPKHWNSLKGRATCFDNVKKHFDLGFHRQFILKILERAKEMRKFPL